MRMLGIQKKRYGLGSGLEPIEYVLLWFRILGFRFRSILKFKAFLGRLAVLKLTVVDGVGSWG